MKFAEFLRHTPKATSHIYGFVCEDDFLLDESKPAWQRIFGGAEWGFEKVSAKEFEGMDSGQLMQSAASSPLFGPPRALFVADAGKLTRKGAADLEAVAALDVSSLKVVLVFATRKSAKLKKVFPTIEIDALRPNDVARWLRDRYKVPGEVARYLVDILGSDLRQLHSELEKLETFVGGARPVEVRDVDELILRSEQFGPFDLDDAMLAGNYARAARIVDAMVEEGVAPVLILSRIARVWRQVFVGKVLSGGPAARAAAAAGVPHWKAGDFAAGCARFEWPRVVEGFGAILRADRALKTSSPRPDLYFEMLLWKLIG